MEKTTISHNWLRIKYNHPFKRINFILFLLIFLSSPRQVLAATSSVCAAENNHLAYINNSNNNNSNQAPKPLMRAWMCHGRTHREMVEKLASAGIARSPICKEALLKVDRKNYVLDPEFAYDDAPQPIGYGATISAPHMHAHVLEDLLPPLLQSSKHKPDKPLSILDVGCGSGYLVSVFGRMVEKERMEPKLNKGKVYGIDVIPQLVEMSRNNIMKEDGDLLESDTVQVMVGDGWKGYPEGAPYNAIHVGAAAATFPKNLMAQLAVGGVMVIPVGPDGGVQYLYRVERVGDDGGIVGIGGGDSKIGFLEEDFKVYRVLGVRYVPLVRTDD